MLTFLLSGRKVTKEMRKIHREKSLNMSNFAIYTLQF